MDHRGQLEHLIHKHGKNSTSRGYLDSLNISIGASPIEENFFKIRQLGRSVLLCSGKDSMRRLGVYQKLLDLFSFHRFDVVEYAGIQDNPTIDQVRSAISSVKNKKIDFIFCIGGGSVIDFGKAVSVAAFGDVWEFIINPSKIEKSIPLVACATTAGTGSHVTPYAVITNKQQNEKRTLKSRFIIPKFSFTNTEYLHGVPSHIVAATGFDVLCHAMETYTRKDCDNASADFAMAAIELVSRHLLRALDPENHIDRCGMAYADTFSGIAIALRGTHLAHAISHPISCRFPEISHGQALAYICPKIIHYQIMFGDHETRNRYKKIGLILANDPDPVSAVSGFIQKLGLSKKLRKISSTEIEAIYEDTIQYRWTSAQKCPAMLSRDYIRRAIHESLCDIE